MICDSHIHFIPKQISEHTSFYKGVWSDKDKLYEFLEQNNIGHALLGYPSTDAHIKLGESRACELYNSCLENIIRENPKIVAAGIVALDELDTADAQIKRLKDSGFQAISLPSSYQGKFIVDKLCPLFAACQEHNLAIFVHPQTINPIGFERAKDPLLMPVLEYSFDISMFLGLLMMQGVFEEFNLKFIFSSLAGVVPFLKDRFDRVYTMLRKRQIVKDLGSEPSQILNNVYVDTSGSCLSNIQLALDLFGEDRILWGSDYPVNANVGDNLVMLDALGKRIKEKIVSKNFLQIFKPKESELPEPEAV